MRCPCLASPCVASPSLASPHVTWRWGMPSGESAVRELPPVDTAARLVSRGQAVAAAVLVAAAAAEALLFGPMTLGPMTLLRAAVALAIAFYIVFVGLKVIVWQAAARSAARPGFPPQGLPAADDPQLPRYTVLVPLCGEANVVERLVAALSGLYYPARKLQILLLLLEEYDEETQAAVRAVDLPAHFEVLIAPDAGPRTKPKACNAAFSRATGDIVVIYDAEDRPEPDQLLRAAAGFRELAVRDPRTGCLQARLAFWNPRAAGSAPTTGPST